MRDYRAILLHLVVWSLQLVFLPVAMIYLMLILRLVFWALLFGAMAALYTVAEILHRKDPKRGKREVTD